MGQANLLPTAESVKTKATNWTKNFQSLYNMSQMKGNNFIIVVYS